MESHRWKIPLNRRWIKNIWHNSIKIIFIKKEKSIKHNENFRFFSFASFLFFIHTFCRKFYYNNPVWATFSSHTPKKNKFPFFTDLCISARKKNFFSVIERNETKRKVYFYVFFVNSNHQGFIVFYLWYSGKININLLFCIDLVIYFELLNFLAAYDLCEGATAFAYPFVTLASPTRE